MRFLDELHKWIMTQCLSKVIKIKLRRVNMDNHNLKKIIMQRLKNYLEIHLTSEPNNNHLKTREVLNWEELQDRLCLVSQKKVWEHLETHPIRYMEVRKRMKFKILELTIILLVTIDMALKLMVYWTAKAAQVSSVLATKLFMKRLILTSTQSI